MDCVKCITNGIDLNRKMAKAVLFGAITAGVTAGAYVGIRKIAQLVEDKRLARYYEDEIEEILQEKEKMQFYEDEFKRQEKEEEEALAALRAVKKQENEISVLQFQLDALNQKLRELEKAGYIVRRQLRGPGGRISDTEYTIYEKTCPGAEEPPEEPGPDTTPPDTGAPDTAFPYLVEPDMVEPSTEKPAELNTKRSNIQKSNTHLSNTHSFVLSTPELEGMKDVYEKREEIREQIEYDLICTPVNRTQVDEFVELMLEVAMTRSPTIKIGRDAEYPTAFVQQRFEQITSSHIEKVLDGISENNTRVWNAKAYLLAALFNAPSSTDNHYTMLVNHDFHHDYGG